jgi:hypothetical protein
VHKKLLAVIALFISTLLIATVLNTSHHTAIFSACPNTEYCTDLGRAQQSAPVRIEYAGWPFKVKIGNSAWCELGPCEGNNFHPDYRGEFYVYNAAIVVLPAILSVSFFLYRYHRALAKRMFKITTLTIVSLVLGWVTVFATRSTIVWSVGNSNDSYKIKSGIPIPDTLHMAYDCYMYDGQESISCAKQAFRTETSLWHSNSIVYINWIFWTILWGLVTWLIMRRYAHTRN